MNKAKLLAVKKLVGTKNFVLLTDSESFIVLKGIHPDDFGDVHTIASHQAELEAFREKLDDLIKLYNKRVDKVLTVPTPTGKRKVTKPSKADKKAAKEDK